MHWHLQTSESKANPRHYAPGNHAPPLLRRLPATVRRCAAWSVTAPRHCTTHSRTASAPHPRKRTAEPSKEWRATTLHPHGTAPWHQDSGSGHLRRHQPCATIPVTAMPSRPLHHHTQRCGARGDRTPPRQPLCFVRPPVNTLEPTRGRRPDERPLRHHPRSRSCMGRHDAPPEAGFARTTVYSMALPAMPLHVGKIVWHTCKLLPPWPIKGGAVPQPQGDDK
jgi:hypothetical protein